MANLDIRMAFPRPASPRPVLRHRRCAIVLQADLFVYWQRGGGRRNKSRRAREVHMRPWLTVLFSLLCSSALAQSTSAPELQFDSVPNFVKLPPDMHLGEATGVAVNSKGNVYVYSRGGTIANA